MIRMETPFGPAWAAVNSAGALTKFYFGETENSEESPNHAVTKQVREFFEGRRTAFDLPLDAEGTPFQLTVWKALITIPFGKTMSYGELAERIGRPGAARAVGRANATNPISLIVPCHRVIGANGTLTGYAGGMELKKKLLDWEAGIQKF